MVYCHSIYKNIYSLSDRNIILFRLSPVRLNLLLVKSIPSVLKILSAVVEVATTHKYFLAKFTSFFFQNTVNHDDTLDYKRLIGYNTINR